MEKQYGMKYLCPCPEQIQEVSKYDITFLVIQRSKYPIIQAKERKEKKIKIH